MNTYARCSFFTLIAAVFLLSIHPRLSAETQKDNQETLPKTQEEVPRISTGNLIKQIYKGQQTFIVDVRTEQEYRKKHIASAVSIPLNLIESRINEFPRDKDIVLY
ncbi:MAG: rhodanese-like domain-containing protein [Candidatus Mariimomonas ferrooxydans]